MANLKETPPPSTNQNPANNKVEIHEGLVSQDILLFVGSSICQRIQICSVFGAQIPLLATGAVTHRSVAERRAFTVFRCFK